MTNRKHHVKDKQITTLSGWFHSPLRVGERAIISGVNGFSILTSPILTILERLLLCMLCIYSDSKCHRFFPLPAILSLISHSPQNVFPVKCHHSCDQYTHLKKPHVLPNHSHTVF